MKTSITSRYKWDTADKENLGDGLTQPELYFWAEEKRRENQFHIDVGHDRKYGLCPTCGNCLCGRKDFRCICPGKTYITPYRVRAR